MGSEGEDLQAVLAEPSVFEEVASEYNDAVDCYRSLRDEAKRSLTTFDQYMAFYSACLREGPRDFVLKDLDTNAARSLKNMVLRSSRAGRQFPVYSVAELSRRVKQYQELEDGLVTPRAVAFAVLEHIFDSDEHENHVYEILDSLLDETPDAASELTAILARARFVVATKSMDRELPAFEQRVDNFATVLPDFYPEDDRSGSELMHAAEQREYSDPEKVELIRSSLARQGGDDALEEFLYLSARDVIERYRHGNRNEPWRGELQLAVKQLDCLLQVFGESLSTEQEERAQSYQNVALGELKSGGRWRSQRDPNALPEANFLAAGNSYLKASNAIFPHDKSRFIKYLSRSFRHVATASRHRELGPNHGWTTSKLIHKQAIDVITNVAEDVDGLEGLTETVVETVALHNYRRHRASAVAAFDQNNFATASDEIDEAFDHLDAVPVYESTEVLKTIRGLIEARKLELEREFETAHERYEEHRNPALDLEKRIALVEIKKSLVNGEGDIARETAQNLFGASSPVLTAVQIATGENEETPSVHPPVLENVLALDQETRWKFTLSIYLASSTDGMYRTGWVEESLLAL